MMHTKKMDNRRFNTNLYAMTIPPQTVHLYDLGAFYSKVVLDFTDSQWDNGGYGATSVFMDILRDRSIGGKGSGETVW